MYSSFAEDIKKRTKAVAVSVIVELNSVKYTSVSSVLVKQLTRSVTSIGANYRSSLKARSKADFISKLSISIEEADECLYWIELIVESGLIEKSKIDKAYNEIKEILLMLSKTKSTIIANIKNPTELHEPIEEYN